MRVFFLAIFSLILVATLSNATPEKYASGRPALDAFLRTVELPPDCKVVGMTGFYGQDQPRQWLILVKFPETGMLIEYAFAGETVEGKRTIQKLPQQDLPSIEIPAERLKVDSDIAFQMVEDLALTSGIGYDSVHYQLRCRAQGNEPVWMVNMLDPAGKSIGIHYISAETGQILRSLWHPGRRTYQTAVPKGPDGRPESLLYGGKVTEITLSGESVPKKREVKRVIKPKNN